MVKDSKDSSVFSDIFNVVSMRATEFPALFDFFLENIRNMDPEHIDVPTLSMIAWFKGDGDTLLASIDELRKFDGTSIVAFEAVLSSGITEKAEKLANEVADKQSIYLDEPIVESYTKKFPESAKKIADIFLNKSHYDEASLMYAWLGLSDQALQVSRMSGSKYTRDEILAISGDFTAISLYLEERFKVLPHLDNHESCLFVRRLVDRGYDDLARKVFDLCYEHKKVPGDSDLVEMAIALGDKDEIMNHVNESFRFEEFDDIHSILYALNNMETDFRYADLVGNIADKIKNSNNKSFK